MTIEDMEFYVEPEAVDVIMGQGCRVWADGAGLKRQSFTPPAELVDFERVVVGEIEVNIDRKIPLPRFWEIKFRRLPQRVEVLWDGWSPRD